MSQQRHLAAILFTDIVGYTALMQRDEQQAVALIRHYNSALENIVTTHEGKVLNYYGDGSLCTFPSATEALFCAMELQKELQSNPPVPLRIGLHIGEIFYEDGKALGDGVNIASRIQSLGQTNTILFSKEIFDKIKNHREFSSVKIGLFEFKNVDDPVEVFALANEGLIVPKQEQMGGKLKNNLQTGKNKTRKTILIWSIVMIMLVVSAMTFLGHYTRPKSGIEKSIAVLPFLNMSTDPQQAFFADGMMDEILNHLYKIGGIKVVSRTSSLNYKGSQKNSTEIARELGVGNLLEGSVQKDGDSIRIIVQLINGRADDHLWAETYVRKFKDIFSIQSDIAQQIALSLKVKIDPSVKERIESEPTKNTEAYSLYLKAQEQGFDSKQSKLQLETAIRLDSTFANAYVGLAYYWLYNGGYNGKLTSHEIITNADPLLKKAIQLNPDLVDAHVATAYMALLFEWDFAKVEKEYNIVQRLSPSNPENSGLLSLYLMADGRASEALNIYLKSFKLDSTEGMGPLAMTYYFNGNSKKALEIINMNIHMIGTSEVIWSDYIKVTVFVEDFRGALRAFEKYRNLYGSSLNPLILGYTGIAYYKTGQKDSAEKFLNILRTRADKSSIGSPSFFLAGIYSAMGAHDKAIQCLQKAFADREVEMYWLKVEPPFISLHNDPRFKALVDKMGLK